MTQHTGRVDAPCRKFIVRERSFSIFKYFQNCLPIRNLTPVLSSASQVMRMFVTEVSYYEGVYPKSEGSLALAFDE